MFSNDIVKKIVYAIEQASAARFYHDSFQGISTTPKIAEPLDKAIAALRAALIEAANAE